MNPNATSPTMNLDTRERSRILEILDSKLWVSILVLLGVSACPTFARFMTLGSSAGRQDDPRWLNGLRASEHRAASSMVL